VVVAVELPKGGRGQVALDSAAGASAATFVIVAIEGEKGSSNAAAMMIECIPTGLESGCSS